VASSFTTLGADDGVVVVVVVVVVVGGMVVIGVGGTGGVETGFVVAGEAGLDPGWAPFEEPLPDPPTTPPPGDMTHCRGVIAPCPTALSSESSIVVSDPVGNTGDDAEPEGAVVVGGVLAEADPAIGVGSPMHDTPVRASR
jgi:hypothetical protein